MINLSCIHNLKYVYIIWGCYYDYTIVLFTRCSLFPLLLQPVCIAQNANQFSPHTVGAFFVPIICAITI